MGRRFTPLPPYRGTPPRGENLLSGVVGLILPHRGREPRSGEGGKQRTPFFRPPPISRHTNHCHCEHGTGALAQHVRLGHAWQPRCINVSGCAGLLFYLPGSSRSLRSLRMTLGECRGLDSPPPGECGAAGGGLKTRQIS